MKTFFKIMLWLCVAAVIYHLLKYLVILAVLMGVLWLLRKRKTKLYADKDTGEVFTKPRPNTVHFE